MRKNKAIIAIIVCFALAASLLAGCASTPGKDGVTPHIGENGNWWIGDADTGVKAAGPNGTDGTNGVHGIAPHIGENGNWWIGDVDTGVEAAGQNGEIAEYTTPEMFGAVGDGVADDTSAVQKALKTGKPVFLRNTYRVTELDCTGLTKIVMYGKEDVTARLSTFPVKDDTYNIVFEGELLFKNAPENIFLQQLRFFAKNAGALIETQISGAWVHKCNFTYFDGVFMGGMKAQSQITENIFFQLSGTLATDCIDSVITNNYINGRLSKCVTLLTGTNFTGMHFSNNYVDYFKIGFGKYEHWEYNLVVNNIFECIFRVFETKTMLSNTSITGNAFYLIYYTDGPSGWDKFADAQMMSEEWRIFTITGKCDKTNISGNVGNATVALKMSDVNNPCDTYIDLSGITGSREFEYYNTSNPAGSSIFVKDLDYITVDSLPSASLYNTSGATLTSFNNQHVYYQGNLYVNNNGVWLQFTNNVQQ